MQSESLASNLIHRLSYVLTFTTAYRYEEINFFCGFQAQIRSFWTSTEDAPYNYGRNVEIRVILSL